jgi:cellulose synthase/poly-beta-1,6-N-acetylglucosamine synthase-like glycosyltransferase
MWCANALVRVWVVQSRGRNLEGGADTRVFERLLTPEPNIVLKQSAPKLSQNLAPYQNRQQRQNEYFDTLGRLNRLGLMPSQAGRARRLASINGSSLMSELFASGDLDKTAWYKLLAQDFSLEFLETIDPDCLILTGEQSNADICKAGTVRCLGQKGATYALMAPSQAQSELLGAALRKSPSLRQSIKITRPDLLEKALLARSSARQIKETVNKLPLQAPEYSAKYVLTQKQAFCAGVVCTLLPVFAWLGPWLMLMAAHLAASLLFGACVLLRVRAARHARPKKPVELSDVSGPYPVYSVLVALYRETEVVEQLCAHLGKLNWPASRLEVIFVCEESDAETLAALQSAVRPFFSKIICVPAFGPQTKPRALTFALPSASGEFVVIFDAEDRPHPDQLIEAYARFQREPMRTACLQSPLVITNAAKGFLPRMFAFEYSALFGGLLPFLASKARLIPLGGTSNHFRRSILVEAAAWDPYNVTEDADLGTRLCRMGYGIGMLSLPTLEDAPVRLAQWLPQRTRWFKGWMQTWLVHMRNPARFLAETGAANTIQFQILTLGMVFSALLYPLMLLEMVWMSTHVFVEAGLEMPAYKGSLFAIDFANVVLGHFGFLMLGVKSAQDMTLRRTLMVALGLPIYWTLLSAAAWRAAWQLGFKPHIWEKTDHSPVE